VPKIVLKCEVLSKKAIMTDKGEIFDMYFCLVSRKNFRKVKPLKITKFVSCMTKSAPVCRQG